MIGSFRRLRAFLNSLSVHLVVLLTVGISVAASLSLLVAGATERYNLEQLRMRSVVSAAEDIRNRLDTAPALTQDMLAGNLILGAQLPPPGARITLPGPRLTALLQARFGRDAAGQSQRHDLCFPDRRYAYDEAAFKLASADAACWLVRFRDGRGAIRYVSIGLPRFLTGANVQTEPSYLLLIFVASVLLASITAYFATKPIRRLTRAAEAFSLSSQPEPLPEAGPTEVRTAIATFNMMQRRVSEGHRERTSMLAAISHDLQTPLTRLRLRLDEVEDDELRARLIADLSSTQSLVREGLDLARSSENREAYSIVDIDSLIESIASDAIELGADVTVGAPSEATLPIKLEALTRCISNLVDNAVKYGGSAHIDCRLRAGALEIAVRDHGPGIPEGEIERMFEPFVRGEQSRSRATGGTGIGLTIVRAQTGLFGGKVSLRNHPGGGLVATIVVNLSK